MNNDRQGRSSRPPRATRHTPKCTSLLLCTPPPLPLPAADFPVPEWFQIDTPVDASVIVPLAGGIDRLIADWDFEGPTKEVIFVDDGDGRGQAAYAAWTRHHAGRSCGRILVTSESQGWAQACNTASLHARGQLLVFLDSDARVSPGWLEPLLNALDDSRVGLCGPLRLRDTGPFHGTIESAGCEWRWDQMRFAEIGSASYRGFSPPVPLGIEQDPELIAPGDRQMIPACGLAIPSDLFRYVGGFDAGFDADLNLRVREAGYRCVLAPESHLHVKGSTPLSERDLQAVENKWVRSGRIDPFVSPRPTTMTPVKSILIRRSGGPEEVRCAAKLAPLLKAKHEGCILAFATDFPKAIEGASGIDFIVSDHVSSERFAYLFYDLDLCCERRTCNMHDAFAQYVGVAAT